jgi:serine/threonine protein kinase
VDASAFCQVLLGIRHLHRRGLVHRELKPANLLITDEDTIVIADFGLSKVIDDTFLKTMCGTYIYAAPENFHGCSYGPEVDIWSTGVIFLELIYALPSRSGLNLAQISRW